MTILILNIVIQMNSFTEVCELFAYNIDSMNIY